MLGRTTVRAIVSLMAQMVKKKTACNTGDPCLNPGSGRSPGEGNGYTLQYSSSGQSEDIGNEVLPVDSCLIPDSTEIEFLSSSD